MDAVIPGSMSMNTPLNFQFDGKNAAKAFFLPRRLVAFEAEIHTANSEMLRAPNEDLIRQS
jgi:hypothetical protein